MRQTTFEKICILRTSIAKINIFEAVGGNCSRSDQTANYSSYDFKTCNFPPIFFAFSWHARKFKRRCLGLPLGHPFIHRVLQKIKECNEEPAGTRCGTRSFCKDSSGENTFPETGCFRNPQEPARNPRVFCDESNGICAFQKNNATRNPLEPIVEPAAFAKIP